jgi:ferredoxin
MAKHPNNAEGKFWIDQEVCVACCVCIGEAPENIKFDDDAGKSYVVKQPENDAELAAVREAVTLCPVEAPREDA